MTITLSKKAAVILIALVGMLAGLALGQLTQALSAQPTASTSANYQPIVRQLRYIEEDIGDPGKSFSLTGKLVDISGSLFQICANEQFSEHCRP